MGNTPAKTQSLSSILSEVDFLTRAINEAQEAGDLQSAETAQNFIESVLVPALQDKTDAIAFVLNVQLKAEIEYRKGYLEEVKQWAKQPEEQLESLKNLLKFLYDTGKLNNVVGEDGALKGQQHQIKFGTMDKPAIDVDQQVMEQQWTPEQVKQYSVVKVSHQAVKDSLVKAVQAGKELPPGVTVRYPTTIRVTMKKGK